MTRAQLVATMSNQEFVEWSVYYQLKAQSEELAALKAKARGGRR